MRPEPPLLSVQGIAKHFKGLVAVDDVTFDIAPGSLTALIGPNGAGKTTLFNVLTGFLAGSRGAVHFDGARIDHMPAYRRARRGLVRTFQMPRVFRRLTVIENLLTADPHQPGESLFGSFLRPWATHRRDREARQKAHDLLVLLGIERLAGEYAGAMSGGQRKLIELGRVLMTDPKMVMLDEPMAGVNPALGLRLLQRVEQLRQERGITFLFVEHDMEVVMRVSDRVLVLDEGKLIADGPPAAIRANSRVIDAYLGRSHALVPIKAPP
jgi:ABC-type branched-subunit amino acid transport system ATPase component